MSEEAVTKTGTVKWFNADKGYGFITVEGEEKDIFVHISAVEQSGMRSLKDGQTITFDIQTDPKRGKTNAVNLRDAE